MYSLNETGSMIAIVTFNTNYKVQNRTFNYLRLPDIKKIIFLYHFITWLWYLKRIKKSYALGLPLEDVLSKPKKFLTICTCNTDDIITTIHCASDQYWIYRLFPSTRYQSWVICLREWSKCWSMTPIFLSTFSIGF